MQAIIRRDETDAAGRRRIWIRFVLDNGNSIDGGMMCIPTDGDAQAIVDARLPDVQLELEKSERERFRVAIEERGADPERVGLRVHSRQAMREYIAKRFINAVRERNMEQAKRLAPHFERFSNAQIATAAGVPIAAVARARQAVAGAMTPDANIPEAR